MRLPWWWYAGTGVGIVVLIVGIVIASWPTDIVAVFILVTALAIAVTAWREARYLREMAEWRKSSEK